MSTGTRVDLVVSKGTEPETVTVPMVVGLLEEQVQGILNDNLLDLGEVTLVPSSQPAGTVVEQDPAKGEEVPIRSKVDIGVSMGSQGDLHSYTLTVKVPEKDRPVHVRLTVTDLDGEAVKHNRNEKAGDVLTLLFKYRGDAAIVKLYFDGELARRDVIKP